MELCRDYLMGKNTLQSAENDIESEWTNADWTPPNST
jgi:hypothetical protein